MFKSVFAASAALFASAGAALAGPYVNVETNAGWVGDDYTAATTDLHVGFEGEAGSASYYIQAGPAIVAVDGEETDTQFSGKAVRVLPYRRTGCQSLRHQQPRSQDQPGCSKKQNLLLLQNLRGGLSWQQCSHRQPNQHWFLR
jgi:hypothetical protein